MSSSKEVLPGNAEIVNNQITSTTLWNAQQHIEKAQKTVQNYRDKNAKLQDAITNATAQIKANKEAMEKAKERKKGYENKLEIGRSMDIVIEILPEEGDPRFYQDRTTVTQGKDGKMVEKKVPKPSLGVLTTANHVLSKGSCFNPNPAQKRTLEQMANDSKDENRVVVHMAKRHRVWSKEDLVKETTGLSTKLKESEEKVAHLQAQLAAFKQMQQGGSSSA